MNTPEDFYYANWDIPQQCRKCGEFKDRGVFNPKTNEFLCDAETVMVLKSVFVSNLMETAKPWN